MDTEKEHLILQEAYHLFSEKGSKETSIDEIARNLHVSKKTIYSIFKSKSELIQAICSWKMNQITTSVDEVVRMDLPIIQKLVKYLDVMMENLFDVTYYIAEDILRHKQIISKTMNEYLKKAVFGRFIKLFEQAKQEGYLEEGLEPGTSLLEYWEMLSTYLVTQPLGKLPLELNEENPLYKLVGKRMIEIYRGLLNDEGRNEFNTLLHSHSCLSKVFS